MPEQPVKGLTEDYVRRLLGLTQQVYDRRLQREAVAALLEPVIPEFTSFQTSLVTLVDSVRRNPDQVLIREPWFLHTGESLQFAIPTVNPDALVFCSASYALPIYLRRPSLHRFSMVHAGVTNLETAKGWFLEEHDTGEPFWNDYESGLIRQKPITDLHRGLRVYVDKVRGITGIAYSSMDKFKLMYDLGLPRLSSISSNFQGQENHPWVADLSLGPETISLELNKGPIINSIVMHRGIPRLQSSGITVEFDLLKFVRGALSEFPIPVANQPLS